MNQLLFEGRYVAELTATVIRQEELKIVHNKIDWERVYRMAVYHHVTPILYLGILGNKEALPEKWSERFFARYQEAVQYSKIYEREEQRILALCEDKGISCMVFGDGCLREDYPLPEMAGIPPLVLKVSDTMNYSRLKGYLIDLGYETYKRCQGFGECMKKEDGIHVEIYHKLPYLTNRYQEMIEDIVTVISKENAMGPYVQHLSQEDMFLYKMAQTAYRYAQGVLTLREMLDLMFLHRRVNDSILEEQFVEELKEFRIDELSDTLLELAYFWFGTRVEAGMAERKEETELFDLLEKRILAGDESGEEINGQAKELKEEIRHEMERILKGEESNTTKEQKQIEFKRMMQWYFPDYEYMCKVYPVLEKLPILLPICWCLRGVKKFLKRKK